MTRERLHGVDALPDDGVVVLIPPVLADRVNVPLSIGINADEKLVGGIPAHLVKPHAIAHDWRATVRPIPHELTMPSPYFGQRRCPLRCTGLPLVHHHPPLSTDHTM
ncbi:MAG: hypothetical protein AAB579_02935 [Patescibacteria group bacterium]